MRSAELVEAVPGPKYAGLDLAVGQRIAAVRRHGKFLLLPLERVRSASRGGRGGSGDAEPDVMVVHLGMTGVVAAVAPASHLRVRLALDGPEPCTLYFRDVRRFGRLSVAPGGDYRSLPTLLRAGPDALSAAFTPEGLGRALARTSVAVKTALMSQRPVAGVGNIYADEALWRAAIHPLRPAARLHGGQVEALYAAITGVLEASLAAQGTTLNDYRTVNGAQGGFAELLSVYGRTGRPCPRCGTVIERIVVGGRGTHLCRRCQPPPRARR